jgi:hypothetical protein
VILRAVLALAVAVLLLGQPAAAQKGGSIQAFAGDWRGGSIDLVTPNPLGDSLRDLEVKINVNKDGSFVMMALARAGKAARSGEAARVRAMEFKPTKTPNIYQAQLACDPGGSLGCAWARIDGNRLVVTAIDIDENGAIETQVTERTLEGSSMRIHFLSHVEGKPRRELRGSLQRYQVR